MNKRHIADKEFARAASVCPNVFSVSIDKPCKECGKVIMIPADSGVCMICQQEKNPVMPLLDEYNESESDIPDLWDIRF